MTYKVVTKELTMTVQNIKNIKFQPEDFTERYVLKTPKFYLGIEALIDSSPTMKEVFKEAPIPKLQKEKSGKRC